MEFCSNIILIMSCFSTETEKHVKMTNYMSFWQTFNLHFKELLKIIARILVEIIIYGLHTYIQVHLEKLILTL